MNSGKTKHMSFNQDKNVTININDGTVLEDVSNRKYLGVWVYNTDRDVKKRKAARREHEVRSSSYGDYHFPCL